MIVSRRTLMKTTAALAATAGTASATRAAATALPALVVYDSRSPASHAFATAHFAPRIDVAREDATFWRTLRSAAPAGTITGLTGWSDWVIVRGLLEEKGKRVKAEVREGALFRWTMG